MGVNGMKVNAMQLLSARRNFEAATLLEQALTFDTRNPFTLNNLGVAEEAIGDYDKALKYYAAAANSRSSESVVVTDDDSWRGKPVSEMAAESAKRLKKRLHDGNPAETQAALLAIQGVQSTN